MEIDWKYIVIAVLGFLLVFNKFNSCNNSNGYKENIKALTEANKTYIKDGIEHTESLIVSMKKKEFEEIKNLKGTIKKLQTLVKNTPRLVSATVIENETKIVSNDSISGISYRDTVMKNDTVYIYPEYSFNLDGEWVKGLAIANKDYLDLNLSTRNEFSITQQKQKFSFKNMFKKRNPIITVQNKNPNTYTTGLKSFNIECNHKPLRNTIISGSVGLGLGLLIK